MQRVKAMVTRFSRGPVPFSRRRTAAFLPLPGLAPLDETTVLLAALALLALALAGVGVLAYRGQRALGHAQGALADARERADARAAVLAAARAGFWTWPVAGLAAADPREPAREPAPGSDDTPGEGGGALAQVFALAPGTLKTFDDVLGLLRRADAEELGQMIARLRTGGRGFSARVESADGRRVLDVRGVRLASMPGAPVRDTVWLRDATDAVRESQRLLERATGLGAQNGSLRQVLDALAVPLWARGPDLALVYCNRAYARAVEGGSPAKALADAREIAPGPSGWDRALAAEALAAGETRTRSLHTVVEGHRRLLEISEFPVGGEDAPWRVAGIAIDRTDTEEARAELKRHVAAHAEVLEKLNTGMVIFGPDARVQFFNAAFASMWRFDPAWLRTGPSHGEVLEDLRARRIYPEQPDFQDYKRRRLELYTSIIDAQEELLHLPDDRAIRLVISPHPLGGLIFTSEDVTDRLTLERSYNTLIAVQTETLNNLHEGIAVFGSDGRLKLFNPTYARIWHLDPDLLADEPRMAEVVEATKGLFRYDGPWETYRDRIIASAADRAARAGRFERRDGSVLDYAAVPLPDGAMLFSYIDVTDSVAMQRVLHERNEALVAADRLKSEFVTNVSYELRTPLNTIIGFTEILANQYFGTLNRRQEEYAKGILEASRQLLALIDDILDLALIESGRLDLDLAETDIRPILESVLVLGRENARKSGVSLAVECPAKIGTFLADARRIRQVLFNLVSNATKYTPPKGRIVISARREGDDVVFAVSDTGLGIPEEDRERIFLKFERGTRGDGRGGIGLGLALVKSVVELHGGAVALESEVGKGSRITLRFPAQPPAERPRRIPGQAPWAEPGREV